MTDLYIDPSSGDLAFHNQGIRLTENNAELTRQRLVTSLRTFRGEVFYNIAEGVPYLENKNNPVQLMGVASKEDFDSYIKTEILSKDFVTEIVKYRSELNKNNGELRINVEIKATDNSLVSLTNLRI